MQFFYKIHSILNVWIIKKKKNGTTAKKNLGMEDIFKNIMLFLL